jgi:uncharacterized protein GlcG (DUF336 family)
VIRPLQAAIVAAIVRDRYSLGRRSSFQGKLIVPSGVKYRKVPPRGRSLREENMSFMGKFLAIAMLSLAFTAPGGAQAPQVEKNVSMKMALMIIEGALEQCTKDGYKVSVVVVDKAGNVAASVRGDGTNPHTVEFGRLKAYTARTRGQTSLEFKNLTDKPENAFLKQIPNVVAVGGGVPIKVGNEVIGAVGVSGAPGGEKDEVCANAGIAKVAASLN